MYTLLRYLHAVFFRGSKGDWQSAPLPPPPPSSKVILSPWDRSDNFKSYVYSTEIYLPHDSDCMQQIGSGKAILNLLSFRASRGRGNISLLHHPLQYGLILYMQVISSAKLKFKSSMQLDHLLYVTDPLNFRKSRFEHPWTSFLEKSLLHVCYTENFYQIKNFPSFCITEIFDQISFGRTDEGHLTN